MAIKGHSTILEVGDAETFAASNTFTKLGKVVDIQPFTAEADDIDVSHMESEEQWRDFDPGWAEAGEVEVTLQYEKTENVALMALFRVKRGYTVTFSDGSTWDLTGYINSIGQEVEREDIVETVVGVKISGKPVFNAAA